MQTYETDISPYFERVLSDLGIQTIKQLSERTRHKDRAELRRFVSAGWLVQDHSLREVADFVGFCSDAGLTANDVFYLFKDAERIGRWKQEAQGGLAW
ncbi:MAG: hypothetical protein QG574_3742 [Cyanobacteriota bacterium erpe_2018_sw_21hr_WHONDRS-SW48-000092_B_bin.40]|jgi:hypothetical protein|nr:hypothetical protein [Cyanobacteriota bacterium erpe_2018_sw_21hr_WHONDRS-SW48-000092_B_bin.40]